MSDIRRLPVLRAYDAESPYIDKTSNIDYSYLISRYKEMSMRYTLRQLEVFLATAHGENISQAAVELNMSQSAASSALKELERQFGVQLFDRVGKRLQLNEFGQTVRISAESLIGRAQDLEHQLSQHAEKDHQNIGGLLRVGATLTIGNYLAVGIMSRYLAQHPQAQVALQVENTANIASKVVNFELDIGLIEGELSHPQLISIDWREDELCVFAAPRHPLLKKSALSDADLCRASWVVREEGSGTRQTFDRAMGGLLTKLNLNLELQHTEAIKRAVEANLGIGCLSKIALVEAFKRGSLQALKVPQRNFKRRFYFIVHKQKYMSAGIEEWIRLCRQSQT